MRTTHQPVMTLERFFLLIAGDSEHTRRDVGRLKTDPYFVKVWNDLDFEMTFNGWLKFFVTIHRQQGRRVPDSIQRFLQAASEDSAKRKWVN